MKLPEALQHLLSRKSERREMFLSLLLEQDYVQAAVWEVGEGGKLHILHVVTEPVAKDTWEERTLASDRAISKLDEVVSTTTLHKVVLGLPRAYLTESGDIDSSVRGHIKKLAHELTLTPIGFVPVHQALIHKLKVDEGVPPSVILIGASKLALTLSLYKIGNLVGQETIGTEHVVEDVEKFLKGFRDLEVLPSRILLYGSDANQLEDAKHQLLKHPWPTRANFLHFPKIEILPPTATIGAICLAGTSEMVGVVGGEEQVPTVSEEVPKQRPEIITPEERKEYKEGVPDQKQLTEEEPKEETFGESNVVMVEPETLGFKKDEDILESQEPTRKAARQMPEKEEEQEEIKEEEGAPSEKKGEFALPVRLPSLQFSHLAAVFSSLPSLRTKIPFIGVTISAVALLALLYWALPRATVTILVLPKTFEEEATVTISPTATVADSATKILPGRKQEKTISGEKVIAVTGKKQVGDPAKGAVTIYNKSLVAKTFKKGSIISSGSLAFTLDDDVNVASASESIGSITFGKANSTITASAIGPQSNLPAGTEFTFKEYSSSVAIARNDQPLAGGTSRDVTVVSRADYDALTKLLTADLVSSAKSDLESSVSGREKLIDETIKATVIDKKFIEELDQEAKELHGKLTVSVSGISYSDSDLLSVLKDLVDGGIPVGYVFSSDQTTVTIAQVQVKKDGAVAVTAKLHGVSLPEINPEVLKRQLSGKSLRAAETYLRGITGIGGVEFGFRWTPWKSYLPINKNNISITVAQE